MEAAGESRRWAGRVGLVPSDPEVQEAGMDQAFQCRAGASISQICSKQELE